MKASLRVKVIIASVLLIIICSLLFTVRLNSQGEELLEEKQKMLTHASLDPVQRRIQVIHQQLQTAAIMISNNQDIINAFQERDREQLASLVDPLLVEMKSINIDVLHFHLPDATSFYRAHKPELHGDYLDFRGMVMQIAEQKEEIYGFEDGVGGLNYRYVVPVFADGDYIGSFEVGKVFADDILSIWKQASAGEWYIYEFENLTVGEQLVSTSSQLPILPCEDKLVKLSMGETIECRHDRKYLVNMIPLHNYTGEIKWAIIRVFDNSELNNLQNKQYMNNISFGSLLAFIVWVIGFILLQKLFSPLEKIIGVADLWAHGKLEHPLQLKTGDEIERLANTMESMRSSIEVQRKELQLRNTELSAANSELQRLYELRGQEIFKAAELHKQFLPAELPTVPGVSVAAYHIPANLAGGDFYNVIKFRGQLILYLVDVSGHGLDGAIMNVFIRDVIDRYIGIVERNGVAFLPSEMVGYLVERYLQLDFPGDYHLSIVVAVYDPVEQRITYVNAGSHIRPFFCEKDKLGRLNVIGSLISTALPKEMMVYEDTSINVSSDAWVLLMTTDGIIEEELDGILYGVERLSKIIMENKNFQADSLLREIAADLSEYTSKETYTDDVTILAISGGSQTTV